MYRLIHLCISSDLKLIPIRMTEELRWPSAILWKPFIEPLHRDQSLTVYRLIISKTQSVTSQYLYCCVCFLINALEVLR